MKVIVNIKDILANKTNPVASAFLDAFLLDDPRVEYLEKGNYSFFYNPQEGEEENGNSEK